MLLDSFHFAEEPRRDATTCRPQENTRRLHDDTRETMIDSEQILSPSRGFEETIEIAAGNLLTVRMIEVMAAAGLEHGRKLNALTRCCYTNYMTCAERVRIMRALARMPSLGSEVHMFVRAILSTTSSEGACAIFSLNQEMEIIDSCALLNMFPRSFFTEERRVFQGPELSIALEDGKISVRDLIFVLRALGRLQLRPGGEFFSVLLTRIHESGIALRYPSLVAYELFRLDLWHPQIFEQILLAQPDELGDVPKQNKNEISADVDEDERNHEQAALEREVQDDKKEIGLVEAADRGDDEDEDEASLFHDDEADEGTLEDGCSTPGRCTPHPEKRLLHQTSPASSSPNETSSLHRDRRRPVLGMKSATNLLLSLAYFSIECGDFASQLFRDVQRVMQVPDSHICGKDGSVVVTSRSKLHAALSQMKIIEITLRTKFWPQQLPPLVRGWLRKVRFAGALPEFAHTNSAFQKDLKMHLEKLQVDFDTEVTVGPYQVDFLLPSPTPLATKSLVIEAQGPTHYYRKLAQIATGSTTPSSASRRCTTEDTVVDDYLRPRPDLVDSERQLVENTEAASPPEEESGDAMGAASRARKNRVHQDRLDEENSSGPTRAELTRERARVKAAQAEELLRSQAAPEPGRGAVARWYDIGAPMTATTKLKHVLLQRLGHEVLHVPIAEWVQLRTAREKETFLRRKIRKHSGKPLDHVPSAASGPP
ncbi:unnamed protein product [Amoebophrya sp. A25]|nr:unnamed protein product [Amoebophrya sp. A25]|eukprot:GSA25T00017475001.1